MADLIDAILDQSDLLADLDMAGRIAAAMPSDPDAVTWLVEAVASMLDGHNKILQIAIKENQHANRTQY